MGKVKKLKRKKKFRANVNRKRLRNRLRKLPAITCKPIKEAWSLKKSTISNLTQMGLVYNPNKAIKVESTKQKILDVMQDSDENIALKNVKKKQNLRKIKVVKTLEEDAHHPRERLFRLPKGEVQFATYMIDKYKEDYKAMVKDRKNHYQLTWRQIKKKIDKFKSVPEQYAEYLENKGEIVMDDQDLLKE